MLYAYEGEPFADFKLLDAQQMPQGYWVVVKLFADDCPDFLGLWKFRLLWKRDLKRKRFKPLRVKGPLLPVEPHQIEPVLVDDWIYGVKHNHTYGFFVDNYYHEIGEDEDVYLSSQMQSITVLDMIAACSRTPKTSEPQSSTF